MFGYGKVLGLGFDYCLRRTAPITDLKSNHSYATQMIVI